ncbi:glutamate-cysteine ligase family protein [Deinococcus sp.]|uniref:glutamate-cysteine ligase family protein n=1 Tax=Deinococcus sp. TaxID=47478 RepID=UPI003B597343
MPALSSAAPLSYGLEEEVFVLYQGAGHSPQTSLGSLWPLGGLLWQDPLRNWAATATNFRRGEAARQEVMSSVEVSTRVEFSAATLFAAALSRRQELSRTFPSGQLIALGALPGSDRYHTAGLHIHVGVPSGERQRVYGNLAYFLPVLALASASSPYFGAESGFTSAGPLSRVAASFALGALGSDPYDRFQDIIITRRLGTIELRVLDPVPDPERLWAILQVVERVARWPGRLPHSREEYNALRAEMLMGIGPALQARIAATADLFCFDPVWTQHTEAARIVAHTQARGWASTRAHLDGLFRTGIWQSVGTPHAPPPWWHGPAGFARYYLPKLPYIARKAYLENRKGGL